MPHGKPAGIPCVHLDEAFRCGLFGSPLRPAVCGSLQPHPAMCGASREEALTHLSWLEEQTNPAR